MNETNGIGTPPYTRNREAFRCQRTHLPWYTYEFAWVIMQRTLHYWLTAWSYLIMERLSEFGIHNSPKISEESLTLIIIFFDLLFCGFAKIISEVIEIPKSFQDLPFFWSSPSPKTGDFPRWSQILGGEKLRPPRRSRPNMCWESWHHERFLSFYVSRIKFIWTTDDTHTHIYIIY